MQLIFAVHLLLKVKDMVSPLINYSSKAYGELCFWAGCILYY